MSKKNILAFAVLLIITLTSCYKVERETFPYNEIYITVVGGTVTAEDSTPIKNILVESTGNKAFTDEDGYYEIRILSNSGGIELKFTDFDANENGGQFCSEKLSIDPVKQSNKFENNVQLQKMVKIHVCGRVKSKAGEPIKKIVVKSEIDRTVTDENGYYEIYTGAKAGENAIIEFEDRDLMQNGGKFLLGKLEIPLEKDNTFNNNITLDYDYVYWD